MAATRIDPDAGFALASEAERAALAAARSITNSEGGEFAAGGGAVAYATSTGFTGGYTTFSTYSYEAALLIRQGAARTAIVYLLANVLAGMLAVAAGILLAGGL